MKPAKVARTHRQRALDQVDRRILALLQQNARLSNKDLAQKINLSPTPCLRRVSLLEDAGVLRGYRATVDAHQLGFTVRAFITIKRTRESDREAIWERISAIPEVIACHVISGE